MKKTIAALTFALISSLALALPTPKDIQTAVEAGHLTQADTMLREVIKEKPNSAKAHYELGEVLAREGRAIEARQELVEAQRLDPSLKFASTPERFRDLLNKLEPPRPPAANPPAESSASHVAPVPVVEHSFPWIYVIAGGGVLILLAMLISRFTSVTRRSMGMAGGGAVGGYGPGYGAGYGAPPQSGSGIGGAVLGGVAGMAAGYGLAKILEGEDGHKSQQDAGGSQYTPIESAPQPDYGSFDAGSGGDSWDSGGDSSSSDDSW